MKIKLSCPLCRHSPLGGEADSEGWPKILVCPQCNWMDADAKRCRAHAEDQWKGKLALQDPAERKRRQEEIRRKNNADVTRSYNLK